MNLVEYLKLISDEYFYICRDKTVLEIGPNSTIHSSLIISHNPKYLKLIEANSDAANALSLVPGINEVVADDALMALTEKSLADVVVCCGVLYHLHSPLHLLELITNNCNPDYIILDCVIDQQHLKFLPEIDNITGNRYTRHNWKSAKFNFVIPFDIINASMLNMGYKLVKQHSIQVTDYIPKNNSWLAMWRNNETK